MGCGNTKNKAPKLTKQQREEGKRKVKALVEEASEEQGAGIFILKDYKTGTKEGNLATKERSRLTVLLNPENELHTLCFQPNSSKINHKSCQFTSSPINGDETKKIDKETRTRFGNTSVFPYSVHGIVRVDLGNGSYKTGTGILIGADLVLTAAHNLYDFKGTKEKYPSVEFIPGMNEQDAPFGVFKVIESYVPGAYLETWEQEDYALLVLDEPAGVFAGYFGLCVAEKEILKGKELQVIGYPGVIRSKDELQTLSGTGRHQLWGMKGKAWSFEEEKSSEGLINYGDIVTSPGQEGSGVFYRVKGTNEYYVIGIHISEKERGNAAWITKTRFNQIESWVGQARRNLLAKESEPQGALKLKKLDLNFTFFADAGVEALVEYSLPNLETLTIIWEKISKESFTALVEKTKWPNLTLLDISNTDFGAEGAAVLSKAVSLKKLTELYLPSNALLEKGAQELFKNTAWTNLTVLDVSSNSIGRDGVAALTKNVSWTKLKEVNLQWNELGDEGVMVLCQNSQWPDLTTLLLSENQFGAEAAKVLSQTAAWTKLVTLDLSGNPIKGEGAAALTTNNSWTNLTTLVLSRCKISDEGARGLSKNTSWTILAKLDLSSNELMSEGAKALGENVSWKNLVELNLSSNVIDDVGAAGLGKNESWVYLSILNLTENKIGNEGEAVLLKRWPNLSLF